MIKRFNVWNVVTTLGALEPSICIAEHHTREIHGPTPADNVKPSS